MTDYKKVGFRTVDNSVDSTFSWYQIDLESRIYVMHGESDHFNDLIIISVYDSYSKLAPFIIFCNA